MSINCLINLKVVGMRRRQRLLRQRRRDRLPAHNVLCLAVQVQQPQAVHPRELQVRRHSRLRRLIRRAGLPLALAQRLQRPAVQVQDLGSVRPTGEFEAWNQAYNCKLRCCI